MKHRRFKAGRFALSGLALATACLWGLQAHAVGLGRLTVQSALGEPLRAEIDVTSLTPEEAATLQLRVASPDAYKAAGVDYNAVLPATQLQLVRQPDGRAVIRVTSSRAVVEPFVDVIVEMNWASGKLVREVTMLFDPPITRMAAPAAPATAPVMSAAPPAAPVRPRPAQRTAPRPEAPAPVTAAAPAAPATAPAATTPTAPTTPTGTTDQYRVVSGDTLSRIAQKVQRPSVSLDQMLVALFRDNPEAFIGRNMNRLKAGEVLTVPSAEAALQISRDQAREVIQAQSADFDAYRRQLASGVAAASTEAPGRHAKGSVQAMVQDSKQPAVAPADKLTLSQGAVKATAPEAAASADAERKDSATRAAELSRNVEDLKQLQAATAQASAPAAAVVAAAATTAAAATASASAATVEAAAATPPVAVVTAAASTAAPPASATVAKAPAPQAASREPGAFDSLLDNPLLLPGAGVLLALLAGLGVYRLRSRARASERETSFLESRLQPDSFFGASGGQRIDTHDSPSVASSSAASSMSYSLSQLDAIGDVDPVAEADVYLAYGRDLQAEEILKEAMRANPDRLPIRTKLLEVYAKRRDTKGYELLAGQLFALAGADSDDWKKAQELGRQIDPSNPLYAPGGQPNLIVREGGRIVEPLDATTMPRSVMPTPSEIASSQPVPLEVASGPDLDLDLNLGAKGPAETTPGALEATRPFTTGASMAEPVPAAAERAPSSAADKPGTLDALDFDLGELALDAPVGATSGKPTRDEFGASLPAFDLAEEDGDALSRKLELAEEFRQIGDLEGARDLLEEVIAQSDGTLKSKAQGMLASLT